jgi:hypothetical protein
VEPARFTNARVRLEVLPQGQELNIMGLGAVITVVFIIAGLVQALAPIFKSISEANERARRQSMPGSGGAQARSTNDPGSFLSDGTQQDGTRPVAGVSRSAKAARSSEKGKAAGRQSARPKKQQGDAREKPAPKSAQSRKSGVGAHVDSFIGQHVTSHIGHQIGDAVKNDISDQVRSHLGEDKDKPIAPATATTHGSVAAGDLLLALRSPQGVKQAIMISEVLSKPKALRRS